MNRSWLTPLERHLIEEFAAGDKSLRPKAVKIFHKHVCDWVKSGKGDSPHMAFMSEIDSPCPDFGLRAYYRNQLLARRAS
jgi:hypothetical protein